MLRAGHIYIKIIFQLLSSSPVRANRLLMQNGTIMASANHNYCELTGRTVLPLTSLEEKKKIPLIFSADFEALKSLPSLESQSLPFMGGHQISAAIQEKSPGFACAAEISRPAEGCILVALCCYLSAPLRT